MADVFYYFRDHSDPPAMTDAGLEAYWMKAAEDITLLASKWKSHPLVVDLGLAIYGYLEKKCKAKGGGSP